MQTIFNFFKKLFLNEQWPKIYFGFSLLTAVFLIGVIVGMLKLAPVTWITNSVAAFQDWEKNYLHYSGMRPDKFIRKARPSLIGSGVVNYDKQRAYPGVTLITSMWSDNVNGINLIDMDGKVLHTWRVSFNKIWADTHDNSVKSWPETKINDWDVDIHGALLYPDGSVVFNFEYNGLVKIDKCSNVIWKLPRTTHHSIEKDEQGNLWVPGKKVHHETDNQYPILKNGIEEDLILKVSPEGKVIKEIPVIETIYKANLSGILLSVKNADASNALTDIGHLNSIAILPSALAKKFPMFNAGDILISLRNLNLILVLDPETEKVKWWAIGSFAFQHDANFMDDGRISLFDNRGEVENPQGATVLGSRILAIDPKTNQQSILYRSGENNFFHTPIRGKQQSLPNGNILITEWAAGRVFEVTRQGDTVWTYLNRYGQDEMYQISQAIRYDVGYANFLQGDARCTNP